MERSIKVLVVDDSAFMRKVITDILMSDQDIEVIGTAKNGQEALEKAELLKPDVLTLDVEMPVMDGLTCLKELLKKDSLPVVMLSNLTRAGTEATIKALEYGAIDFIAKPTNIFEITGDEIKKEIIEKVKIAKKSIHIKKPNIPLPEKTVKQETVKPGDIKKLVAIGTSTGGPRALQSVIPLIPGNIQAAILIVQHMPPGFTKSLAERLNNMSKIRVKEAEDGELVKAGIAYMAPGNYHMTVKITEENNLRIKLTQDPPVGGHRPAVNVMMESVAKTGLKNVIAVIMTGMGGDGSEGIKKIKSENNGYIIAQDEQTSTVYGMPKMAVQTGVVDAVVPLGEITQEIMKIMGVQV
ncbi:MAG: chemotaxis response regulator protein-glutamate methylesterase [Clostridia bacterium]|nr:chemotaxis response regulator protein-glutamate methylesterase [Clostridia bacterium]